ncbi:Uncharacterised protein [Candidatus Gugararchaeum adminiculabundum]|nr:Uncharacterised protein [Candidatus Gugararchaeum adminiculabundum]
MAETKIEGVVPYPVEFNLRDEGYNLNFKVEGLGVACESGIRRTKLEPGQTAYVAVENSTGKTLTPVVFYGGFADSRAELRPGENKVGFVIKDKDGKEVMKKTWTVVGEGVEFKSNGINVVMEGSKEKDYTSGKIAAIDKITSEVASMNSILGLGYKVGELQILKTGKTDEVLRRADIKAEDSGKYAVSYAGQEGTKRFGLFDIEMNSKMLEKCANDDQFMKVTVMHEVFHTFHRGELEGKDKDYNRQEFENLFLSTKSYGDRAMGVFSESSYMKVDSSYGNPTDKYEFFACASSVLYNFPQEFMKRVNELKGDEKEAAMKAAAYFVNTYDRQPNPSARNIISPELKTFVRNYQQEQQVSKGQPGPKAALTTQG